MPSRIVTADLGPGSTRIAASDRREFRRGGRLRRCCFQRHAGEISPLRGLPARGAGAADDAGQSNTGR